MKVTGRIAGATIDFKTGKPTISFEVNEKDDFKLMADEMRGLEKLSIEVKPYREKRSLDQNAYAWVLIGKIADKMRRSKDDIYLDLLKRYGQGGVVKVRKQDEKTIIQSFDYYEQHEKLYSDEEKYYRVWVGSSKYNTEEMSIFVDGIISEAKELGIQTLTPDELANMRSLENEALNT